MSAKKKYQNIFIKYLSIDSNKFNENIKYNEIPEWDSIGHMTLIAALEEEYKISLETDDVVDFSSFQKGIEILKKYNVNVDKFKLCLRTQLGGFGFVGESISLIEKNFSLKDNKIHYITDTSLSYLLLLNFNKNYIIRSLINKIFLIL